METSTPISNALSKEPLQSENSAQELSEEDQNFLTTIHDDLTKIEMAPHANTVKAIINYSKSL